MERQPMEHVTQQQQVYQQQQPQIGIPIDAVSTGGGPPVPEERLAQMAKDKWFTFDEGKWVFKSPSPLCMFFFLLFIAVGMIAGIAVMIFVFDGELYIFAGLVVPVAAIVLAICILHKQKLIFDDATGTVYYRSSGCACVRKERTFNYSDCINFTATLRIRGTVGGNPHGNAHGVHHNVHDHSHHHAHGQTTIRSYYEYKIVTVNGAYVLFEKPDDLDLVGLNAFLRERVASAGIAPTNPQQHTEATHLLGSRNYLSPPQKSEI